MSNTNLKTSVLVALGFLLMLLLPFDKVFAIFNLGEFREHYLGDIVKNMIIIFYGYVLIRRFGYLRISGVTNFKPQHSYLVIIPLYFIILGLLQYVLFDYKFHDIKRIDIVILPGSMITVGFSEEIVFRGFVLPNLIKGASVNQSLIAPILLGASLFGVLHFLNLFQSDSYLPAVISQVTYATMFGVAFGIVLVRTGCLWLLGLLHGLINFSFSWAKLPGAIEPPEIEAYRLYDAIISIIIVLPFLFYALKQLSKVDRDTILKLYQTDSSHNQ